MFGSSIRLGRIAGAELSIGPGSVLLAFFLAWTRGSTSDLGVLAMIAVGLGFLVSIIMHELGHLVAARSVGIGVRAIRLDAIGGAAELERAPETGKSEMLVAAGGPAVNLLLGGGALGAATLLSGDAAIVMTWFAAVNLILGVFNLLPGLPFDGGHILVGFRWWRTGDKSRAVAAGAAVGRYLGYALIGFGILQVASGQGFGLWTAFIGWIVMNAARAQGRMQAGLATLGDRTVAEAMSGSPALVDLDATTQQGFQRLWNAPPDAPGLVLTDEDGVVRAFVPRVAVGHQLDVDPRRPLQELGAFLDETDVAFPTETLAGALGRGVTVPFVVIDPAWRPIGVVGLEALRPQSTSKPPTGPARLVAPPRPPEL